jgi:hypothetical protein
VASDEEVPSQEALAGERRGVGDRRGPKRKAAAHVLGQGTEEVGAVSGPAAWGTYPFGERPTFGEPSSSEIHTTLASFSTRRGILGSGYTLSCIDRRPSDLRCAQSASGTLRADYKKLWCRIKMRNRA